ncbi:MAG: hypothetical protein M1158_04060 [Candidatus Marsarchaeota archaeon]|jgi:hypothetical protein|nr:hypothetical protein [Candidatus Marsarchaeota archaeon]
MTKTTAPNPPIHPNKSIFIELISSKYVISVIPPTYNKPLQADLEAYTTPIAISNSIIRNEISKLDVFRNEKLKPCILLNAEKIIENVTANKG